MCSNAPPSYSVAANLLPNDEFNVVKSETINIMLVGRTQTGKSTIVQTLTDPTYSVEEHGFSDTREPECKTLIVQNKKTNLYHSLKIIDTPGLKEVMKDGEVQRTDAELLSLIARFLELNVNELNVICFVSRAGETHLHDIEVFNQIIEFLGPDFGQISMMVLTHCDSFSKQKVDQFENDIQRHLKTKPTYDYCKLGLERYGAVSNQKILAYVETNEPDDAPVDQQFERIRANQLKKTGTLRSNLVNAWIKRGSFTMRVPGIKEISQKIAEERQRLVQDAVGEVVGEYKKTVNAKEKEIEELKQEMNGTKQTSTQDQRINEEERHKLNERLEQKERELLLLNESRGRCAIS